MLFSPAASSLASTPGGGMMMNATTNSSSNNNNNPNASASNNGGVELEINWDPTMVKNELLQASAILSHRGLKLAAKWAAEQVVGIPVGQPASLGMIPPVNNNNNSNMTMTMKPWNNIININDSRQ